MARFGKSAILFMILFILVACTPAKETAEKGGTLQDWRDRIWQDLGPLSEVAKTLDDCETAIARTAQACPSHQGWRLHSMMEITEFSTDTHYEFQDVQNGGCPDTSPTGEKYQPHDESAKFDSQTSASSEYQVLCDTRCVWWECTTKPAAETWKGTFDGTYAWDRGDACSPGAISMQYEFEFTTRGSLADALNNQDTSLNIIATEGMLTGTVEPSRQPNPSMLDCKIFGGSMGGEPIGVDAGTVDGERRLRLTIKAGTRASYYVAYTQIAEPHYEGKPEPIDAPELLTFQVGTMTENEITGTWMGDPYASGEFKGTVTLTKSS